MYIITKCTLGYVTIYFPLSLNKTAQRNSQHCTKLQNEVHNEVHSVVHNVLHSKTYSKNEFCLYFDFA